MKTIKSKNINIRGIERNSNDINVTDGASDEIINLRNKDGAWRPVGSKTIVDLNLPSFNSDNILYHHSVTDDNLIKGSYAVQGAQLQFSLIRQNGASYTSTLIYTIYTADETFQSITSLNNILIITTDYNRYFFLWDYDTESYSELEEIPMPLMYFEKDIKDTIPATESFDTLEFEDLGYTWGQKIQLMHDKLRESLNSTILAKKSKGVVSGMILLRFAYKLYDGSYIKHSNLFYLDISNIHSGGTKLQAIIIGYPDRVSAKYLNIGLGGAKFTYMFTTEESNILSAYKNLILGIDIFITDIIPSSDELTPFATNIETPSTIYWNTDDGWSGFTDGIYESSYIPHNTVGNKQLLESINFYKIHSISFDDLIADIAPSTLIDIDFSDIKNLQTKETLPVDNFTHHQVWGNKNYNYNSRLHFGNITTKLFKGFYPMYWTLTSTNETAGNYALKTWIKTDKGTKIVYNYFGHMLYDAFTFLSNIITYPDSRAYKCELLKEDSGSYYSRSTPIVFNLTPHPFLNFSYVIPTDDLTSFLSISSFTLGDVDPDIEDNLLTDTNRAQVSRLDNALVYEAKNSYQIGNDDETILGFGSVVEPLSDGQFGQFPLYIFTTAGIFVLEQGTGEILYSNILPLNKEVCNNSLSITDIGGGVVYSTDKGLRILSGKEIIEISQIIEGTPEQHLINNTTYQEYLDDENFVQLLSDLSTIDFLTYIENAIIGYDYNNKEIIVSNRSYTFSYVYSLENKTWHKIKEVFMHFVKFIPETYGSKAGVEGHFYNIKEETFDYIDTLIQTRPIKLDTQGYKSINELILRGWFDVKELTYSGIHLFGSLDGKNYFYLRGVTPQDDNTYDDIFIRKLHTLFKYLIIVFAGQLKDSSINYIETTYFEKYNNKLRP